MLTRVEQIVTPLHTETCSLACTADLCFLVDVSDRTSKPGQSV